MPHESLDSELDEQNPPTFRDALRWVAADQSLGFHVISGSMDIRFTILNPGEELDEEPAVGETWVPMTKEFAEDLLEELAKDEDGIKEGNELGEWIDSSPKNVN